MISTAVTYGIDDDEGGLRWGKGLACCGAAPWVEGQDKEEGEGGGGAGDVEVAVVGGSVAPQ
jgi:hypothetical protein